MQNLGDVIKSLKEIERVSKKSYIVLASGENDQERNKFYRWTLIGTTILLKKEWKTLFKKLIITSSACGAFASKLLPKKPLEFESKKA